jgi:hypothetical protein
MIEPLDALLETLRAGTGALVVVEGQTARDDPWFYTRWFGHRAREVRFVHQDGHDQVKKAVAHLREHAPGRPVFGLVDRDFSTHDPTDTTDVLAPGLYRTGWYTLENYFFCEPAIWLQILDILTAGEPPPAWQTLADLHQQILRAYEGALVVAAWNRTVHDECRRVDLRSDSPGYREHPKAITDKALSILVQWGQDRGAPDSLHDRYNATLAALAADPAQWPEQVTGKAAYKLFVESFPALTNTHAKDVAMRRLYMDRQPPPPPDLAAIIDDICREAATYRRAGA